MPKTPRLRTREQITVRYKELEKALQYWQYKLETDAPLPPFIEGHVKRHIVETTSAMEALMFALNDTLGE